MQRIYTLYMHINIFNNKKYIGITRSMPKVRWQNGRGYKSQYFNRAIKKYGWNNFKHEIIFCNLTKEEAENLEIEIIKFYKSNNPKYGYNISNGGNTLGTHSEESKLKMSKIKKENPPEYFTFKNKNHTQESKTKISETMKLRGVAKGKNNNMFGKIPKNSRMVECIDTGKIYLSMKLAQEDTGVDFRNIFKVCNNERKTAGGLRWKYLD